MSETKSSGRLRDFSAIAFSDGRHFMSEELLEIAKEIELAEDPNNKKEKG